MERELALKIACISAKDRAWVIANLSSEEQQTLKPLLDEIEELGLNQDRSVVNAVLETLKLDNDKNIRSSELDKIKNVDTLDAFWQSLLLGSVDKKDRVLLKRKFGFAMNESQIVVNAPMGLKKSLIKILSE